MYICKTFLLVFSEGYLCFLDSTEANLSGQSF